MIEGGGKQQGAVPSWPVARPPLALSGLLVVRLEHLRIPPALLDRGLDGCQVLVEGERRSVAVGDDRICILASISNAADVFCEIACWDRLDGNTTREILHGKLSDITC